MGKIILVESNAPTKCVKFVNVFSHLLASFCKKNTMRYEGCVASNLFMHDLSTDNAELSRYTDTPLVCAIPFDAFIGQTHYVYGTTETSLSVESIVDFLKNLLECLKEIVDRVMRDGFTHIVHVPMLSVLATRTTFFRCAAPTSDSVEIERLFKKCQDTLMWLNARFNKLIQFVVLTYEDTNQAWFVEHFGDKYTPPKTSSFSADITIAELNDGAYLHHYEDGVTFKDTFHVPKLSVVSNIPANVHPDLHRKIAKTLISKCHVGV